MFALFHFESAIKKKNKPLFSVPDRMPVGRTTIPAGEVVGCPE
jgi:hypothetical protein